MRVHHLWRDGQPGDGAFGVRVVLDAAVVVAGCLKVEHGPAAGPALRSLIDPNIIHQQRLGKGRAGIGTSGPLPPDRDVQNQKERVVEHPP